MKFSELMDELHITLEFFTIGKRLFDTPIQPPALYGPGFLGEEKKDFLPSPYFMEKYMQNCPKVFLQKKAAYLFTCGRDVFAQGIAKTTTTKPNKLVLVYDEVERPIGMGITQTGNIRIKNIYDIGIFLRREMTRNS